MYIYMYIYMDIHIDKYICDTVSTKRFCVGSTNVASPEWIYIYVDG